MPYGVPRVGRQGALAEVDYLLSDYVTHEFNSLRVEGGCAY